MRIIVTACFAFALNACGAIYHSPGVQEGSRNGSKVRVLPITAQSILIANRSTYQPQELPAIFSRVAGGTGGIRGTGALPEPALTAQQRPRALETRIPPRVTAKPYQIGIGDVVLLATPQAGNTVAELSGLLAAQNRRQGYMVQDDGMIAIPDVGRIRLAGLSLENAEAVVFQHLVENQINPAFSLEISEFNSRRVSIGGAVKSPAVVSIALTPLYLNEALAAVGGITVSNQDYTTIRIYRDGTLYQIPLRKFYADSRLQRIRLHDKDSVFVDTQYDLEQAQAYFEEQIRLAEFRQGARQNALTALTSEIALRRAALEEARNNFSVRLELGAVERDYVYLTGEVKQQSRYALPFGRTASLADALFDQAGGIPTKTGNVAQIYVLRGSSDPREFASVTAWQLDARNAAHLLLAARFELRPNDVIFVAEQPVTRWSRVVQQLTPSLITTPIVAASN